MTDGKEPERARIVSRFIRTGKPVPREAYDFLQRGEFNKGIEYLDKLLQQDPNFEHAWEMIGVAYFLANRYEEAIAAYDKALAINPQNQGAKEARQMVSDELNKKRSNKTT